MPITPTTQKQIVDRPDAPVMAAAPAEAKPIVRLTPTPPLVTYPASKELLDWCQTADVKTIPQLFRASVKQYGDSNFLGAKRDKAYQYVSYKQVADMADQFSSALVRLGLPAGNRVGIISPNEVHWPVMDLGTQQIGGIVTPMFPELGSNDMQYILKDSGCKVVVVGNEKELQRLISIEKNLPDLEHIIVRNPTKQKSSKTLWTWDEFMKMGTDNLPGNRREIEHRQSQIKPTDIATVVYTSGTTADPKGVMMAHGAFVANIQGVSKALHPEADDIEFSFLPMSHIFERSVYYAVMAAGASSAYAEGLLRFSQNLGEAHPTMIPGVPRMFDMMVGRMEAEANKKAKYTPPAGLVGHILGTSPKKEGATTPIADALKQHMPKFATQVVAARLKGATALQSAYNASTMEDARKAAGSVAGTVMFEKANYPRQMFNWGMKVGKAYDKLVDDAKAAGTKPNIPLSLRVQHELAARTVYPKLQAGLGGKVRLTVAGGAPLGSKTDQAIRAFGPQMSVGYGMTEHPVISFNPPDDARNLTAGTIVPGVQVKIADDGEILVKSPATMNGYLGKPQDTADTIDTEGWLHTGDIGVMKDGYLTITDRKKNLLVLANGKKVPPAPIEATLEATQYIETAVCLGDNQKHVGALIVPNFENLETWAKAHGQPTDKASLAKNPEVYKLIKGDVEAACKDLSDYEKVYFISLLDHEFTKETGELTETLKVKRNVVKDKYKAEIAAMFKNSD